MSKNAGRRLRLMAVLAVAGALAVAGVASARGTGDGSGEAGNSTAAESATAPKAPKGGPGAKGGPAPGGPPPMMVGGPGTELTNGELHVLGEDGDEETIRLDQGEITAIGDDSLTLKENDGSTVTVKVDDDTAVMSPSAAPGKGSLDDLETGDEVTTSGPEDEAAATVAVVPSKADLAKGGPKAAPDGSGPPAVTPRTDSSKSGDGSADAGSGAAA